jgi:hypothetical protein
MIDASVLKSMDKMLGDACPVGAPISSRYFQTFLHSSDLGNIGQRSHSTMNFELERYHMSVDHVELMKTLAVDLERITWLNNLSL